MTTRKVGFVVDVEPGESEADALARHRGERGATPMSPLGMALAKATPAYYPPRTVKPPPEEPPFAPEVGDTASNILPPDVARELMAVHKSGGLRTLSLLTVSPKEIAPSPLNPRKGLGDLSELVASVKRSGILQPLLVRPGPDGGKPWELVCGHRRLAAALEAGIPSVQATVRHLDDGQALEAQVVENVQRESLAPLEEAEAFHALVETHHRTVEEVAQAVSKSVRWVYTRLSLRSLVPEAKKALAAERISPSVALLLARIPAPKVQAEALDRILPEKGKTGLSVTEIEALLREDYTTELRGAPFDTKDPLLVPEAGPCTKCPKRSGNDRDLFGDIERADVCTDVSCFKSKAQAAWEAKAEAAKAEGKVVLPLSKGREIFRNGPPQADSPFVELDAPCHADQKRRTWREILTENPKVKEPPAVHVAQGPDGKVHELAKREEALAVLASAGLKWAAKAEKEDAERKPASAEEKAAEAQEEELRRTVARGAFAKVLGQVEDLPCNVPEHVLRLMALAHLGSYRAHPDALERRGGKDLEAWAKKASAKELLGLLFDLLTWDWCGDTTDGLGDELKALCRAFKVDLGALDKATRATAKAEADKAKADALFAAKRGGGDA